MRFHLTQQQQVFFWNTGFVTFRHRTKSGEHHDITLNKDQVLNLNDIFIWYDYKDLTLNAQLGGHMWLICEDGYLELKDYNSGRYFKFATPKKYIKQVHPKLMSFLCHGVGGEGGQHHARRQARHGDSSRRVPSQYSLKTLHRKARNAPYPYEQRKKRATISSRNYTNSRRHFRPRGSRNAERVPSTPKTSEEDEDVRSIDAIDDQEPCVEISF